jgi:hypothetical protein
LTKEVPVILGPPVFRRRPFEVSGKGPIFQRRKMLTPDLLEEKVIAFLNILPVKFVDSNIYNGTF